MWALTGASPSHVRFSLRSQGHPVSYNAVMNVAESQTAGLDVQALRAQFPLLSRRVHGQPIAYLDNAATSQKPQCVLDAVIRYYREYNANVHRGLYKISEEATNAYEQARAAVARFVGAGSAEEIIYTRGTTEAINLVASSFGALRVRVGDEILVTAMEHHSNIVPWQLLCERTGATLKAAPISDRGELEMDRLEKLIGERTRVVAVMHVSNVLGTINPIQEIVKMAHRRGAAVLVDGAQAAPHLRVNVRELGCDFYTLSGHKMYAPTGIGALFGKAEHLRAMPPYHGGGEMVRSVSFEGTTYKEPPARFEAGTPNIAGAIGLAAAIEFLEKVGLDTVAGRERELLDHATRQLSAIEGLRIIGTAAKKAAVVSFDLEGIHPHDLATILDRRAIAIRAGHHCAQPLMKRFDVPATTRASLAFYNTTEEIDRLVAALREAVRIFR